MVVGVLRLRSWAWVLMWGRGLDMGAVVGLVTILSVQRVLLPPLPKELWESPPKVLLPRLSRWCPISGAVKERRSCVLTAVSLMPMSMSGGWAISRLSRGHQMPCTWSMSRL